MFVYMKFCIGRVECQGQPPLLTLVQFAENVDTLYKCHWNPPCRSNVKFLLSIVPACEERRLARWEHRKWKEKLRFILEQTMKVQKWSRRIAVLFL